MTTYNTGNPVGSPAVKDLYDNAENFDEALNGASSTWTDRRGTTRKAWASIENNIEAVEENANDQIAAVTQNANQSIDQTTSNANAIIAGLGYQVPLPYEAGINLSLANQTVAYDGKVFAPISARLPFTTSGTFESDKFRLIQGVATADLSAGYGAAMVGYDGDTVQAVLDEAKPMQSYTALRNYAGRAKGARITLPGIAGTFQRDDADTTTPDDGGIVIVDASGRRWKRDVILPGGVNVKWFGAKGDGTDDTDAMNAAFDYLINNPGTDVLASIFGRASTSFVYFPAGRYDYYGDGVTPTGPSRVWAIRGDGPDASSITIHSDIHLLNGVDNNLFYVEISDMKIVGGRGAFYYDPPVSNIQHARRFYNCVFIGYTSCCIGAFNGFDTRYRIVDCIFDGADTGSPVGICLPPGAAEVRVVGCTFRNNRYHIVTNPIQTRDYQIGPNNAFFKRAGDMTREADIWIIPSPNDSCERMGITYNRFSNEGFDPAKPTILIADRDTSTDTHVFTNSTTKTTNSVKQLRLIGNSFQAAGYSEDAVGLIYSYSSNVNGLYVSSDTFMSGHRPCVIEYDSSITGAEIDAGAGYSNFGENLSPSNVHFENFSRPLGGGLFTSAGLGNFGGSDNIGSGININSALCTIWSQSNSFRGAVTGNFATEIAQIVDSAGGATGATFQFSDGTDRRIIMKLDYTKSKSKKIGWVEFEARKSSSNPVDRIAIDFRVGSSPFVRYSVSINDEWQRFRFPFILSNDSISSASDFLVSIFDDAPYSATKNCVDLGRMSIYFSKSPSAESITVS